MAQNAQTERLLTTKDLAERHHRSPAAVLMDRYRGNGPKALKIGNKLLFRFEDVLEYEAERAADPRPAA